MKKQPKYSPEAIKRAQCVWSARLPASTARSGQRSNQSHPRSAAHLKRFVAGYGSKSVILASVQGRLLPRKSASRLWNGECVSYERQTRSCVWRVRFSPRRSSTAASSREDVHRPVPPAYGVEPICRVMQGRAVRLWRYAAQQSNPALRCARAQRDDVLSVDIERVWQANLQVYGADKVWRQLRREGTDVARCTVERLMRKGGLRGVVRGKVVRTTVADTAAPCPLDRVNRQFKAQRPNQLWVSDFTYVSTWQASCTWPSSSTSSPAVSLAGASAARCGPTSYSTPWNRPCMRVSRNETPWSITATGGRNTYR